MSENKHANIYEAMSAAYDEVGYVRKKRGDNLNYTYAGEKDIIAEVRPAMVEHGIFCHVVKYDDVKQEQYTTARGSVMLRSTLHAVVRFAHESGTYIDVEAVGEGSDSGDKSLNKAMTCAYKYALRQTFVLETGDDPDKDASVERKPAQAAPQKPTTPQQKAPEPEPLSEPTEPQTTEATQTGIEYAKTEPLAKVGKHNYPVRWAQLVAAYKRANIFEVDGILQKLRLPQSTRAENVIDAINEYLDQKG